MNRTRAIALAGVAALVVALAVGFWPTHADFGFATTDCGSALKPVHAADDYDTTVDPMGVGLAAANIADGRCEAARSGPTYVARGFGFAGMACLLVAAGTRGPQKPWRSRKTA
ncbi:hypothetical protein [Actinomadura bangladeshensis]|uniref:Uncharacterized protein n=1 Tax=Actinomadura bangladeshensis TaxID=453573 RepID=A0A6L9Q864_9ACTN|nr:hypothetical protein [Actinomadura bangladeshensis]NEA21607.1 hypothetical protein [Actinomadura bangladeshensis]NEA22567.1 hypothetical protein [Actinomadura bangladeshensis]